MTTGMTEEQIYELAKKRVEEKRGFFIHFGIYIVINIMLILIWWFAAGGGFPSPASTRNTIHSQFKELAGLQI